MTAGSHHHRVHPLIPPADISAHSARKEEGPDSAAGQGKLCQSRSGGPWSCCTPFRYATAQSCTRLPALLCLPPHAQSRLCPAYSPLCPACNLLPTACSPKHPACTPTPPSPSLQPHARYSLHCHSTTRPPAPCLQAPVCTACSTLLTAPCPQPPPPYLQPPPPCLQHPARIPKNPA